MADTPARCQRPACGKWTFTSDGYCDDYCAGRTSVADSLRGVGIVSPPTVAKATRQVRVRRNTSYFVRTGRTPQAGYLVPTREASYLELARDVGAPRTRRNPLERTVPTTRTKGIDRVATDKELMARMGTVHDEAIT